MTNFTDRYRATNAAIAEKASQLAEVRSRTRANGYVRPAEPEPEPVEAPEPTPPAGSFDGGTRGVPRTRSSLDEQIAAAEAAGDGQVAMRLKMRKLGDAVNRQRAVDFGAQF
jgi:hypothetical protein